MLCVDHPTSRRGSGHPARPPSHRAPALRSRWQPGTNGVQQLFIYLPIAVWIRVIIIPLAPLSVYIFYYYKNNPPLTRAGNGVQRAPGGWRLPAVYPQSFRTSGVTRESPALPRTALCHSPQLCLFAVCPKVETWVIVIGIFCNIICIC